MQTNSPQGRWFYSSRFDLAFFHLPIWLGWLIIFFLVPQEVLSAKQVPIWAWVAFVLLLDVGHVWATLYRTYWDRESRQRNLDLLIFIPVGCFLGAFALAYYDDDVFWTVLAYIAVFHFVKQQYGITALHHIKIFKAAGHLEGHQKKLCIDHLKRIKNIDKLAIYSATLIPVLHWHVYLPKKIWWFSKWDFIPYLTLLRKSLQSSGWGQLLFQSGTILVLILWVGSLILWLGYHLFVSNRFGLTFPLGKVLWVLATYFNWYVGIVYFNSPFAFTLTNVIAHGRPYFGLVYMYSESAWRTKASVWMQTISKRSVAIFVFALPILFFAFWEEYVWDVLVRGGEYSVFFSFFLSYPRGKVVTPFWFAFWIALLSVPQATHYFLDRYLWRNDERNPHLKQHLHL